MASILKIIKYTLSKVIDENIEEKLIDNIINDEKILDMEINYDLDENKNNETKKKFICEECGCENYDYISLMDHVLIVHDKSFKTEYMDDYIEQKKENKINNQIKAKTHECMICSEKFETIFHLGEHFTNDHANYETQTELDNNIIRDGYPSLDILLHINMVHVIPFINIDDYKKDKCYICMSNFHYNLDMKIYL